MNFDNCKWPLLKALVFLPISKFDYILLIFRHELHLLYVHFRRYEIQGTFVSLCSTIIIPSLCKRPPRLALMMICLTYSHLSQWSFWRKHVSNPSTRYEWPLMCENFKKFEPKMMIFELCDFLVAHVCNFSRLALQESLL